MANIYGVIEEGGVCGDNILIFHGHGRISTEHG